VEGRPELTADNTRMFDRTEEKHRKLVIAVREPFSVPKVTTSTAQAAYEAVVAGAGAIPDSQWEVGAFAGPSAPMRHSQPA